MRRVGLALTLLASLTGAAHAADTGAVVEHLYHHTYLVRPAQLTCLPGGACYRTIGQARVVYDESLGERLELRCDEDGDNCQRYEQEAEGEADGEAFTPKPMHWQTEDQDGDEQPA